MALSIYMDDHQHQASLDEQLAAQWIMEHPAKAHEYVIKALDRLWNANVDQAIFEAYKSAGSDYV